jgi:hypothetical protein
MPTSASLTTQIDVNGQIPTPTEGVPALPPINTSEPALAMLLNHFGQMQQQMADQFQQQMMMMLQMFNGMHREQMATIREELDRLRELSMEVHTLRAKYATPPPVRPHPGQAQIPGYAAATPRPSWNANPTPPTPPPPLFRPAAPPTGASGPNPNPTPGTMGQPTAPPFDPNARGEPIAKPSTPPPDASNLDPAVHDWLNTRLVAIQREQQSRWQKILGMLGQKP